MPPIEPIAIPPVAVVTYGFGSTTIDLKAQGSSRPAHSLEVVNRPRLFKRADGDTTCVAHGFFGSGLEVGQRDKARFFDIDAQSGSVIVG